MGVVEGIVLLMFDALAEDTILIVVLVVDVVLSSSDAQLNRKVVMGVI